MTEITHVVAFEYQNQKLAIYKWDVDWLFISENLITHEIKGNLCLCFEQASDLMDTIIKRGKIWIN
jgi:hypothetical protein